MRRLFVLLSLALLLVSPAVAQETRIAAVVNDDVISLVDLNQRVRMVLVSSNLEDTPQTRQRVAGQVLRGLVDEKLQMQEAKRLGVKIDNEEVDEALGRIAAQNRLPKGGLDAYLRERGIEKSTLTDQIRATIAWGKLVRRRLQTVTVSEDEIDEALARQKETEGQPLSRVAEIFLAVDDPRQEDEVHRFADRLFEQMKQGAAFPALAQQFSQSATAAVGGDIGWVTPNQLGGEVGQAVQRLNAGEVSPPVRAAGGYYILYVIDRRVATTSAAQEAVVQLVQVVFPVPPTAPDGEKQRAIQKADEVSGTARSCGEMLKIGQDRAPQTSGDLGRLKVRDMPAELRETVMTLPIAQPSKPLPLRGGVGVLMVCARDMPPGAGGSDREQVNEMLTRQRAETLARRYLRDLRRTAFVDVRV
jgi:peptidyl-prolyl cis-trans isomerase SurA